MVIGKDAFPFNIVRYGVENPQADVSQGLNFMILG